MYIGWKSNICHKFALFEKIIPLLFIYIIVVVYDICKPTYRPNIRSGKCLVIKNTSELIYIEVN